MVLSNKKLKQRIREELVKSLSVSLAETNQQSQSLKELFDSASHKPRLSKREKRRNSETCVREDETSDGIREKEVKDDVENGESIEKADKSNSKKRKRDDTVQGELSSQGDGGIKEEESAQKKKKKKKQKKKKKKVKKTEEDNVEEKAKIEEIQVNTEM